MTCNLLRMGALILFDHTTTSHVNGGPQGGNLQGSHLLTVERALGLRGLDASGARASKERRYLPSRLKA